MRPGTEVQAIKSLLSSPLPTPLLAAGQTLPTLGAYGPQESPQPCSPASSFLVDSGRASASFPEPWAWKDGSPYLSLPLAIQPFQKGMRA